MPKHHDKKAKKTHHNEDSFSRQAIDIVNGVKDADDFKAINKSKYEQAINFCNLAIEKEPTNDDVHPAYYLLLLCLNRLMVLEEDTSLKKENAKRIVDTIGNIAIDKIDPRLQSDILHYLLNARTALANSFSTSREQVSTTDTINNNNSPAAEQNANDFPPNSAQAFMRTNSSAEEATGTNPQMILPAETAMKNRINWSCFKVTFETTQEKNKQVFLAKILLESNCPYTVEDLEASLKLKLRRTKSILHNKVNITGSYDTPINGAPSSHYLLIKSKATASISFDDFKNAVMDQILRKNTKKYHQQTTAYVTAFLQQHSNASNNNNNAILTNASSQTSASSIADAPSTDNTLQHSPQIIEEEPVLGLGIDMNANSDEEPVLGIDLNYDSAEEKQAQDVHAGPKIL